jgi:6-pyruvoyltetrahydropterin/6-carboxytetrahydropterin synthase
MFSAAHRLHNEQLSEAANRELYGKCNNPHGHGHNYTIEVSVSGQVDARTGMVCNLVDIDECVRQQVVERYDHQNLNLLPEFENVVPTTENLCIEIFERLKIEIVKREFHGVHLERVKIEETMMNSFEYSGGADVRR